MVRGKTQMRLIENATSRQVTFSKRRNGLLKKAFELSVLCDAEVAVIIFSAKDELYEFASCSMQESLERYLKHTEDRPTSAKISEESVQRLRHEAGSMMQKIEQLEVSKRSIIQLFRKLFLTTLDMLFFSPLKSCMYPYSKLLGEEIGSCSFEELQQIERQLEKSVKCVRARKTQVFKEQMEQLKKRETALIFENAKLHEPCDKCGLPALQGQENSKDDNNTWGCSDVETQLFIGLPFTRK